MSAWRAIFVTRLMQVFDADVLPSFIDTLNYISRIPECCSPGPSTIGSIAHNGLR